MNKNIPFALQLNKEKCISCGICVEQCSFNALTMEDFPVIDPLACRLCGSCVQQCPSEALTLKMPETDAETPKNTHGIWVLAETENGQLANVTRELLTKACSLSKKNGQPVEAVLIGNEVSAFCDELAAFGAQHIHLVESQRLQYYLEEDYAAVVAHLVKKQHPDILLVGATQRGRGLSARLAALLHTGLTADCTELDIDTEKGLLQQIRPAFGGNLMATIVTPNHRPQMASVRPGVMQAAPAAEPATCEITQHDITALPLCNKVKILDEKHNNIKQVLLEESRIVVGIGKGVKSKELVARLTEWAQQHGAAIAGSRAAVEAGLIEPAVQVGQTGHTISPDVYIAIGISGQIQHTAAIMGAKKIIAINPDANAPIFRIADYGWVATAEDAIQLLG